jgi:hypothetical protein
VSYIDLIYQRGAKVKTVQKQLEEQLAKKTNSRPPSLRLSFDNKGTKQEDKIQVISEPDDKVDDRNRACMKDVAKVILDVATRMETAEKVQDLKTFLDELLQHEKFADLELEVMDIFKVRAAFYYFTY